MHTMVPTCRLPEVVNSEWGTDRDAPNFEIDIQTHTTERIQLSKSFDCVDACGRSK